MRCGSIVRRTLLAIAILLVHAMTLRPLQASIAFDGVPSDVAVQWSTQIPSDGPSAFEQLLVSLQADDRLAGPGPLVAPGSHPDPHQPIPQQPAPVPLPNAVYGFALSAMVAIMCARRFRR
jgi:hypothetical protein